MNGVGMGIVAPQQEYKKRPWVLDERQEPTKTPEERFKEYNKRRHEIEIENLKQKSPEDLTTFERGMLVADKIEKFCNSTPTICYLA